ncbi:MAG: hypothetical protein JWM65_2289, partial [Sphingomonas bacterium]|nr:hypothetical protein [Sphingomonas bacterium]
VDRPGEVAVSEVQKLKPATELGLAQEQRRSGRDWGGHVDRLWPQTYQAFNPQKCNKL